MNLINTATSNLKSDEFQQFVLKTSVCTGLAAICGYGGTFFFTHFNPRMGASYFATVALISQVVYGIFEQVKDPGNLPILKRAVEAIQLLQIPIFFYLLHGNHSRLSAAVKLEIICATAYFTAIPIFFHLAIKAWNEPTSENIGTAMALMIPLASGLASYGKAFK